METRTAPPLDPRTERTVAAYDAVAQTFQEERAAQRLLDAVRKFATLVGRGGTILDPACGPALDMRPLRDAGLLVTAGDLAPESLRVAKLLHPKGLLTRFDLRLLPFADGTFDGLWLPESLHHLPRSQIRTALAELRRVHRRGPVFTTFRKGRTDLAEVEDSPAGTVFATSVTPDELQALLLEAGYGSVEVEERPDLLGRRHITWLHGWGRLTD